MRDYAEQIARLRECASNNHEVHSKCGAYLSGVCAKTRDIRMQDAADAIEELLAERDKYKAYFDNVSSLPDCNVCLKQRVCEFVPAWGENTRINCPLALTEPLKEGAECKN